MFKIYPKLINGEKPKFAFQKKVIKSSFNRKTLEDWRKSQEDPDNYEIVYCKEDGYGFELTVLPDEMIPVLQKAPKSLWSK